MKKTILSLVLFMLGVTAVFAAQTDEPKQGESSAVVKLTVTTDGNGEIAAVTSADAQWDSEAWHIRDVRGITNVRNSPNGKVCMKLKAYTQYEIYTDRLVNGWLRITSIYNLDGRYWVRLHDSTTGTYWIARSVVY